MVLILKENICKIYRADRCSCSYFLCLVFTLIIVIVPFFLAFSTNNFWRSIEIYYEQPTVLYTNEILLVALSEQKIIANNSVVQQLTSSFSSTIGELNELSGNSQCSMDIKSAYYDYNTDYKIDLYEFNVTIPVNPDQLRNLKVFVNFQYRLKDRVNIDMVSLAMADINTANGASSIYLDGYLNLKQKNPLTSSKIVRTVYNNSLLASPTANFYPSLLYDYNSRNESTKYAYSQTVLQGGADKSVKLTMRIRIPPFQRVTFQPIFLQNLKFAWIQYLSLLLPVSYLISMFAEFVFSQQIFETSAQIKY